MVAFRRYLLPALVLLATLGVSSAFYMHKIMAAALLANSLNRSPFLPLPIPIPIPVKAGGNTIIAVADDGDKGDYMQFQRGCAPPLCYSGHGRRIDFWR